MNGMLSLILSVPTGIWMFFSYCRNNQKPPEEGGELPLVFRPCPEDRGGNLSLRLGKKIRLIWWLIAIGSVSLTGVLAWVMDGEAPAVLAVFSLLPLIILVRAIYSSRQRYTLTDSGLEIHSFGTRKIPYQALREGTQGKPPEVNRMCLTLTADGRRIRINTFSMEGADQFLTELFRRMGVERPWNYHYLFKG